MKRAKQKNGRFLVWVAIVSGKRAHHSTNSHTVSSMTMNEARLELSSEQPCMIVSLALCCYKIARCAANSTVLELASSEDTQRLGPGKIHQIF